jgi:uncharacterized protein YkwD
MNGIDLLLIIIFLMSVWSGYQYGFLRGMLDLVVWIGSLLIALFTYQYITGWFNGLGAWAMPVAFIIVLIFSRLVLSALTGKIIAQTNKKDHQHTSNKIAGIVPGAFNGFVWATVIAALLLAVPLSDSLTKNTRNSLIANRLTVYVEWLDARLSPVFDEAISKTINRLTVSPESEKTVKLPFTVTNAEPRPDLETQMLEMVNEERKKEGLHPLKADNEMRIVARKHSDDMFQRGYFSHLTPEGKTPSARMRADNVKFFSSGENLALGQTLTICHNSLMNSPGHRANILHPAYGRLGIGILDGGMRGLMVTQNFRN